MVAVLEKQNILPSIHPIKDSSMYIGSEMFSLLSIFIITWSTYTGLFKSTMAAPSNICFKCKYDRINT